MTDEKPKSQLTPSVSTVASVGIGIPVATILSWICDVGLHIQMPGPVEAAFGAVISAVIGYLFKGGKAVHTEE